MTEAEVTSNTTDKNITHVTCVKCEPINKDKCNVQENGTDNNFITSLIEDCSNCNKGSQPYKSKTRRNYCRRKCFVLNILCRLRKLKQL